MKIAAVNWKLRDCSSQAGFLDHLESLLIQCVDCDLVVLPEMFCLELFGIIGDLDRTDNAQEYLADEFDATWASVQNWRKQLQEHYGRAPHVVVGSNVYELHDESSFLNRSLVLCDGYRWTQDKIVLTEWEKTHLALSSGNGLAYDGRSRVGVTICLDAEFPASGRALAEAGMLFQCVPAWTETMHGFQRVRWACQARAVENQVCVIHSSLVGRVGNEESHGSSAIIVPPHLPFPLDPILAETPMDEEGVAIAEVDPADLLKCREMGEVRNWRDRDVGDWTVRTV